MSAKVSATRDGEPSRVANLFCQVEVQERESDRASDPTDAESAQTWANAPKLRAAAELGKLRKWACPNEEEEGHRPRRGLGHAASAGSAEVSGAAREEVAGSEEGEEEVEEEEVRGGRADGYSSDSAESSGANDSDAADGEGGWEARFAADEEAEAAEEGGGSSEAPMPLLVLDFKPGEKRRVGTLGP